MEAVAATVHASLTGGVFQTGYALFLGAGSFWMGIIGAVPTVSALVQLVSSVWVERLGERKRLTAWFSLLSRTLWLPILLIPWLVPRDLWLYAFVLLFTLSSIALQVPVPAFTSWLSDLVPADHRGRYFGRRNMLTGLTALAATVPTAWLFDKAIIDVGVSKAVAFAVLFAVAVIAGIVSFALLLRQPEPPMVTNRAAQNARLRDIVGLYRKPFGDSAFRTLLTFSAAFALAQFFAGPFYNVYALEELKLSYTWLQVLGGFSSLTSLLSMPLWGYLSDRFGNKPLLTLAVIGVSITPLPWIACRPGHLVSTLVIIGLNNLFGGVAWAGIGLLQFNLLIETTPSEGRSLYVGALSAASGIAGGLAPIIGGSVLELFRANPAIVGGSVAGAYHVLFVLNGLLRLSTLSLLHKVPAPSSATPREVLGRLGSVRVSTLRQLRQLQRADSERVRQEAATALSEARAGLAVQELVLALSDPALSVRQAAATALGEIGDRSAIEALRAVLHQPESGIIKEAALSLGRLGAVEAMPELGSVALAGERSERIAAISAMGMVGASSAEPYLLEVLNTALEAGHEDLAEAAIEAIGRCRLASALPALVGLVKDPRRAVALAAIQAVGEIGDPTAGPALEEVLLGSEDPATITRACVSLAQCRRAEAVPTMFEALTRLHSPVARRQVANAIGALLDDEEMYRLLTTDPIDREAAVVRRIQMLAHRERHGNAAATRRQEALVRRAVELYTNGDLRGAVNTILRLVPVKDGTDFALIQSARHRYREADPSEEEFLVVLAAVDAAMQSEAREPA